jgi:hypothetical protein
MKLSEIEQQLRNVLPLHTDRFTDWISVSSYVVSAGVATITTSAEHGLEVGNSINVRGVVFNNAITSLTSSSGTASATTTVAMDANNIKLFPTAEIDGANESDFNGEKTVKSYVDRTNFTYKVAIDAPASTTGSPILVEEDLARYNNVFTVNSVPDSTTFTVVVSNIADFTATGTIQIANINKSRIAADMDVETTIKSYTLQNNGEWWAFISIDDTGSVVSKDRAIGVDFVSRVSYGDEYKQQTQESFFVYVFAPSSDEIRGIAVQDECRNEVRAALIKSLAMYVPEKLFENIYSSIAYVGDAKERYSKAYYVHQYAFATTVDIITSDTYIPKTTPIEKINADYESNGSIVAEDTITFT